jgi:Regulator of chromosome condensation (RCC1) repeat
MRAGTRLRPTPTSLRNAVAAMAVLLLAGCADDTTAPTSVPAARPNNVSALVVPVAGFRDVSTADMITCGVNAAGGIQCWGAWGNGGPGPFVTPPSLTDAVQVSLAGAHGCAVRTLGQLTCWGNPAGSGVGFGQEVVPADLPAVTQVSAALGYTCVVTVARKVRCWGQSEAGEATVPDGLQDIAEVRTAFRHTCARTTTGTVVCWGRNGGAEIVPAGLAGVLDLAASTANVCALIDTGAVTCWGLSDSFDFVKPPAGLTDAVQLDVGDQNGCAVRRAGSVTCWGDNTAGQATPPSDLTDAVRVSVSSYYACALRRTGAIRCWGVNVFGQATPPTTRVLPTATLVAPASVAAGSPFVLTFTGAQVPGFPSATQFTYQFDCGVGSGFSDPSPNPSFTCFTIEAGLRPVRGKVTDQDGDFTFYSASVQVVLTIRSLRDDVAASSIKASVRKELVGELDDAQAAKVRGRPKRVCSALRDFVSEVREHRGRAIPVATADQWISSATLLQRENGC